MIYIGMDVHQKSTTFCLFDPSQEKAGRYDMRGFRPNEHYVRWMRRFGVLPDSFDAAKDALDPYETDRAYWRSLWYQPDPARLWQEATDGPGRAMRGGTR